VLSSEPDASCRESCEKATELILSIWPLHVCRSLPVLVSQSRRVLSFEPDTKCCELCEKAMELTEPVWPLYVCRSLPVSASQSRRVQSIEPDASCWELCKKETELTKLVWPWSTCKHGLQLLSITGFVIIHPGSSFLNSSRIKLRAGLNIRADAYA
jgi:hypothetical protein